MSRLTALHRKPQNRCSYCQPCSLQQNLFWMNTWPPFIMSGHDVIQSVSVGVGLSESSRQKSTTSWRWGGWIYAGNCAPMFRWIMSTFLCVGNVIRNVSCVDDELSTIGPMLKVVEDVATTDSSAKQSKNNLVSNMLKRTKALVGSWHPHPGLGISIIYVSNGCFNIIWPSNFVGPLNSLL